jgi:hypothetical protein
MQLLNTELDQKFVFAQLGSRANMRCVQCFSPNKNVKSRFSGISGIQLSTNNDNE